MGNIFEKSKSPAKLEEAEIPSHLAISEKIKNFEPQFQHSSSSFIDGYKLGNPEISCNIIIIDTETCPGLKFKHQSQQTFVSGILCMHIDNRHVSNYINQGILLFFFFFFLFAVYFVDFCFLFVCLFVFFFFCKKYKHNTTQHTKKWSLVCGQLSM